MQSSELEQIHDLYEIEHVQDYSIGLLSQEVALQFSHYCKYAYEDGESETHVLQSHKWIIDIIVYDKIEYGSAIEVGGAVGIALDRCEQYVVAQCLVLRQLHIIYDIIGCC